MKRVPRAALRDFNPAYVGSGSDGVEKVGDERVWLSI